MREIKFRAWDAKQKLMLDVITGLYDEDADWDYTKNVPFPTASHWYPSRYKLMQYTGLKDKNGVEIYEGDICQVRQMPDNNNEGDSGQIYYLYGLWWLGNPEFGGYHLHNMVSYNEQTYHNVRTYLGNVIEVIGNIYENSELLK